MPSIQLRALGSYHVGGRVARLEGLPTVELVPVPGSLPIKVDGNGAFAYGQMYVQYARVAEPRCPYPVLMWHGGGMTGACWESTPDGRDGWQSFFLRAGYDVLLSDAVERGRASWARYPEIFTTEPLFMPQHGAWTTYRVGLASGFAVEPASRRGFEGGLFPVAAYDAFIEQIVPRWASNGPLAQAAYDAQLAKEGPSIVIAHSQGAGYAWAAALAAPERVKALVLLEPGAAPSVSSEELKRIAHIPVLAIWGDHIDAVPFWTTAKQQSDAVLELLRGHGADAQSIDLPAIGIAGNSHLLMMDTNSDAIALMVAQWLQARDF